MPPRQKQDDRLDPGQLEYNRNFDFTEREREMMRGRAHEPDNPAEQAAMDRAGAWSRDNRSVAEREAAPSWSTNLNPAASRGGGSGRSPSVNSFLKKRRNQWIIGGLISMIIGISTAVPAALSGVFVHLKEFGSDWAHKNNHSLFSKRSPINMKKRYFQVDPNCTDGVKCRLKGGVSDKEIDQFKKAGLNPEIGEEGGKKFVKSFNTTDVEGKAVSIKTDNFEEHYGNNTKFRAQMDEIAKPKSMLLRGKQTLRLVFDKFGIKRNREIDGEDDKERDKNLRADEYSDGNATEKANAVADDDPNKDATKIEGVDKSINEAAQAERERLTSSGFDRPPSIVPDVTNMDLTPDKATEVAEGLVHGGLKGAVLGIFSAIDKACSGYQLIRAAIFGAKIYKAISLIKYAGIFMTLADKLKAGDAKPQEIGYIVGLLFKPSSKKESYGKTAVDSEGWNLIFQGKIADHRGLARFSTGTPFLRFLQGAKKFLENAGANKTTCKQVKSWYGQLALVVAGLSLDIFSGGSLSVAGIVAGAGIGMVVSVLTSYIAPLLVQYAAGTIAPDPTDPEGGYGAGSALAAGLGALGYKTGQANGARTLTTADAAAVEMESNKEIAFMDKVDDYGRNPFSLDSQNSITTKFVLAMAPFFTAPLSQGSMQSVASLVVSPFSLFGSSMGSLVTHGVNAQSDIDRGGEYCADEDYKAMNIAVDAFCNPIPGEKDSTIKDPAYDPQKVLDYMVDNGHVNDDGTPKSDDYKKYIASCVDTVVPPSPDGGGEDVGQDVDTRWCTSTDEEFNMFRFYTTDSSINDDYNASIEGTLGEDS